MDIEQLKMLLETVGVVSGQASELAYTYIIYLFVLEILSYVVPGGIFLFIIKKGHQLVTTALAHHSVLVQIRDHIEPHERGSCLGKWEAQRARSWVIRKIEMEKNNNGAS